MANKSNTSKGKTRTAPGNSLMFRQWFALKKQKDRRLANPPPPPEEP